MRKPSVMPQQALALANSELALNQAQLLSEKLLQQAGGDSERFIDLAFARILARAPKPEEASLCREFLLKSHKGVAGTTGVPFVPVSTAGSKAAAPTPTLDAKRGRDLVLVLFNHNDFVSIR